MIGTLIGMATMGAYGYASNSTGMGSGSFSRAHQFMMGISPLMPLNVGETLTYKMPMHKGQAQVLSEGFGAVFQDDAFRKQSGKGFNFSPNATFSPNQMVEIKDVHGKVRTEKMSNLVQTGALAKGMSALGPLMSGYFIASGFNQNGFVGAADAYFLDVAVSRSTVAAMGTMEVNKAAGTMAVNRKLGLFGGVGASFGAFAGYEVGHSIAGVPGGFIGAAGGAKAMGLMARYPGVGIPLAVGAFALKEAGEYAVSAVSQIVKTGYRKRKMRQRIDTAGDTAAFFTRNATTTRGRAFESMRKSHLNARSALGMEASMTHLNRSYF